MAKDATDLSRGTDSSTESLATTNTDPTEPTQLTGAFGVVGRVTPLGTQARNLPLSADEAQRLARIRKDRGNRFMVSATDVDFFARAAWEAWRMIYYIPIVGFIYAVFRCVRVQRRYLRLPKNASFETRTALYNATWPELDRVTTSAFCTLGASLVFALCLHLWRTLR